MLKFVEKQKTKNKKTKNKTKNPKQETTRNTPKKDTNPKKQTKMAGDNQELARMNVLQQMICNISAHGWTVLIVGPKQIRCVKKHRGKSAYFSRGYLPSFVKKYSDCVET